MSNIYFAQNKQRPIELLRAANAVYMRAKRFNLTLFITSALIPLSINISFFFFENETVKSILCLANLIMILASFVLKETIGHYKDVGSLLQQWYDLSVFDIGGLDNYEKGKVEKYIIKYKDRSFKNENSWYQDSYDPSVSKDRAILLCHKKNVTWTSRLTERYLYFMISFLALIVTASIVCSIVFKSDINDVLQSAYTLTPALGYVGYSVYQLVSEKIKFMRLQEFINNLLSLSKKGRVADVSIYELQTRVYDYRHNKRLVPEFMYKLFYKKDAAYVEKAIQNDLF